MELAEQFLQTKVKLLQEYLSLVEETGKSLQHPELVGLDELLEQREAKITQINRLEAAFPPAVVADPGAGGKLRLQGLLQEIAQMEERNRLALESRKEGLNAWLAQARQQFAVQKRYTAGEGNSVYGAFFDKKN